MTFQFWSLFSPAQKGHQQNCQIRFFLYLKWVVVEDVRESLQGASDFDRLIGR